MQHVNPSSKAVSSWLFLGTIVVIAIILLLTTQHLDMSNLERLLGTNRSTMRQHVRTMGFGLAILLVLSWFVSSTAPYSMNKPLSKQLDPPLSYHWAHAVNSQKLLDSALENASINAIEADIIFSDAQRVPVMGHPPQVDGELTLQSFLDQLARREFQRSKRTIVKLDFKSNLAFEQSLSAVKGYREVSDFPQGLFLNADILQGPCQLDEDACRAKFRAKAFVKLASSIPGAVLSVGWTTSDNAGPYTEHMVEEMLHILEPYPDIQVSFPIRAPLLRSSWPVLKRLYKNPNFGITLWWSQSTMDNSELSWIYSTLETPGLSYRGRTFYDIKGFQTFLATK